MGQAFRLASGRIRRSSLDSSPLPTSSVKKAVDSRPLVVPPDKVAEILSVLVPASVLELISVVISPFVAEVESRTNAENILEERDPQHDALLNHMVGRIRSKPGGKLEMGEASLVDKDKRPLPRLRNTTVESSRYEERPAPTGTLNVAQLRHIILLHQGKAEDHDGPMDVHQIAQKFRVDVVQIQTILQFLSLPPEDSSKQKTDQG